jgi:hypothetical protein
MNRGKLRELRKRIDAGGIANAADAESLRQEVWNIANAMGDEPRDEPDEYDIEVLASALALVLDVQIKNSRCPTFFGHRTRAAVRF